VYSLAKGARLGTLANVVSQYGGSPVKVQDEEYTLFRDHE